MGFSLSSWWHYKCPRCRQGDLFVKPINLTEPLKMPKRCIHCGQKTEPEPGFYFGAMFLSYIFSSFYLLLPTLLLVFYFEWSVNSAMAMIIFMGLLSYFRILRGSRALWLHINVRHDPVIERQVLSEKANSKTNQDHWKPR